MQYILKNAKLRLIEPDELAKSRFICQEVA